MDDATKGMVAVGASMVAEIKLKAIAEGVRMGLLMAADVVEDSRNVDVELCDMLADRIRQMADKEKAHHL